MTNRGGKCRTIKCKKICDTRPIPTPNNNNNYYSNRYNENEDDDDKTIVHRNCTDDVTARTEPLSDDSSIESTDSPNQEPQRPMAFPMRNTARKQTITMHRIRASSHDGTMFNTSKINISVNQSIRDAGATGNFIFL